MHRLAPGGLDELTYPGLRPARFVNWVDYTARLGRADPTAFAARCSGRQDHTLWFVTSPGYITHPVVCRTLSGLFAPRANRTVRVAPDDRIFEHPGLQEFPARKPASG